MHRGEGQAVSIYEKFRDHTMVTREVFERNLDLVNSFRNVHGCVVECGVWKGGMIAGIASILGPDRNYWLYDSFDGLPPARDIDGPAARKYQEATMSDGYMDNCRASPKSARDAMLTSGAGKFQIVQGWFSDTLYHQHPAEPIAILRLDCDWYESVSTCLDILFDAVVAGGVIIVDDYHAWDGCSRAVHDFLAGRKATERLQGKEKDGMCWMVKK